MAEESRARQLGDVGDNAPAKWDWGGPVGEPHLVIMFFAEPDCFEAFVQSAKGPAWADAFDVQRVLDTTDMDGIEPFGFADG